MATSASAQKKPMAGWIMFAAIAMLVVGFIDFFEGIIAAIRKEYYVFTPERIIIFDVSTWGWLMMIWGIVLILAGLALWSGASCGRDGSRSSWRALTSLRSWASSGRARTRSGRSRRSRSTSL